MLELRPTIFPALRYRDALAALEWLQRAFGAEEKSVHRGVDGSIRHAELRLGDGLVVVGQHSDEGWMGGEPPRPSHRRSACTW
jgi:uncharacterized glyoxalase superfamily protein PhnB